MPQLNGSPSQVDLDLIVDAVRRLEDYGLATTVSKPPSGATGLRICVSQGSASHAYTVVCHDRLTVRDVLGGDHEPPPLHLARTVTVRAASLLRGAKIAFLDAAGNAYLSFAGVLLDVRGLRPSDSSPRPAPRRRETGNLFSAARSQVVFALLTWPSLRHATRRELARAAGVSVGQAHNAVTLLRDLDIDLELAGSSSGRARLLDLWASAYPSVLGNKLVVARYDGALGPIHTDGHEVFLSGEAAAPTLLRPSSCVLYTREPVPPLAILNRWRADGPPTITVRRAFWTAPDLESEQQVDPMTGLPAAPWTLVYADLLASADPRVRGVAAEWEQLHA